MTEHQIKFVPATYPPEVQKLIEGWRQILNDTLADMDKATKAMYPRGMHGELVEVQAPYRKQLDYIIKQMADLIAPYPPSFLIPKELAESMGLSEQASDVWSAARC